MKDNIEEIKGLIVDMQSDINSKVCEYSNLENPINENNQNLYFVVQSEDYFSKFSRKKPTQEIIGEIKF